MISNNTSIIYYLDEHFQVTPQDKASFVKKVIHKKYRHYDFVNKEVFWLQKLKSFDRVPNVVFFNDNTIIMDYMGRIIAKKTVPVDWEEQIKYIVETLGVLEVSHNDIKLEEILVNGNKINLIDFQHATNNREEFRELRKQGKTTVECVQDDITALHSIIKNLLLC